MKLVVLNDDRCDNKDLLSEHGLSFLIEQDSLKLLFDVGQSDVYLKNAEKLNINLNNVDYIVLSHGDYDHGEGLKYFNGKTKLVCHPHCFLERKSIRTGTSAGLNQTKQEVESKFIVIESEEALKITDSIFYLGQIDRSEKIDSPHLSVINFDGSINEQFDDSGLAIKTDKGLIVISGCAHSGICNIIQHAKNVTNENKVYAVIGGFHLKKVDGESEKVFEYFKNNNIELIMPCHCNSDEICTEFVSRFKDKVTILKTGSVVKL